LNGAAEKNDLRRANTNVIPTDNDNAKHRLTLDLDVATIAACKNYIGYKKYLIPVPITAVTISLRPIPGG